MSSTRRAKPGADPDASPERFLGSARLRGVSGLNIVCRVACVLPAPEREAMLWLVNFANLCELTGEAVAADLRLTVEDIRHALTKPTHDRAEFVARVGELRARFEAAMSQPRPPGDPCAFPLPHAFAHAFSPIAETLVARKIRNGVQFALRGPQMVEIVAPSRYGKSIAGRREYLRLLHRAAWLHCPKPGTEREFLTALGSALGMSFGSSLKNMELWPRVEACFGRNRIDVLVIDEAHRLIPVETDAEPRRLEWLRDLCEMHGVSIVLLATPQFSEGLSDLAAGNPRWSPAQYLGRAQQFHLSARLSEADLAAVARHHAPDAGADVIAQLVTHAKASEGFCGTIVRSIERARFRSENGAITLADVEGAQRQLERDTRAAVLARRKVIPLRPPAAPPAAPRGRQAKQASTG